MAILGARGSTGAAAAIAIERTLAALASDAPPLLLDFRGAAMIAQTGPLAGAAQASLDDLPHAVSHWAKGRAIVTLCACPGDATAVRAAHSLVQALINKVEVRFAVFDAGSLVLLAMVVQAAIAAF